jgi:C1A family cysteine protease
MRSADLCFNSFTEAIAKMETEYRGEGRSLNCTKLVVLLGLVAVIATCAYVTQPVHSFQGNFIGQEEAAFRAWMLEHAKFYDTEHEFARRLKTFITNAEAIRMHNLQGHTYGLALNQFADMDHEEFKAYVARPYRLEDLETVVLEEEDLPDEVDWRLKGAVTEVKNQGSCGSCWSFSATGSIEGLNVIANNGTLLALSEQQLIDCSKMYGNQGCRGGLMTNAFKYVKAARGLMAEEDYPYSASLGVCRADSTKLTAPIGGYTKVKYRDQLQLKAAVARQPVSVAIQADDFVFQFYNSGVISRGCGTDLNHGVLVVGYGSNFRGKDYWIVKNSWGSRWGKKGYVLIARSNSKNDAGTCGIALGGVYPTL